MNLDKKIIILITIILLNLVSSTTNSEVSLAPREANSLRVENEDKLIVPDKIKEEVWAYMEKKYVTENDFIKSLNPNFNSVIYKEFFRDNYYDTKDFDFLKKESGLRIRTRVNLDNPDDEKNGKTLIQIKVNDLDSNELNRGEFKYNFYEPKVADTWRDVHPVIGKIEPNQRTEFETKMIELGFNPYSVNYILTIEQTRRRIYIKSGEEDFMTISFDEVTAKRGWLRKSWIEIEPELNEIPYTEATPEEKKKMEEISRNFTQDILDEFPKVKSDLTPKYNKAFSKFEGSVPFFKFFVKSGMI